MELQRALNQISEIHAQVLKQELFQGYRAATMATTGVIAVLAACVQSTILVPVDTAQFAYYWIAIAVLCALICAIDLTFSSRNCRRTHLQRYTVPVVAQFLPAIAVGALVTWGLLSFDGRAQALLPGLWSLIYCLGIFSSRPYLPRAVGWVGSYYLRAGVYLLLVCGQMGSPSPWGRGVTFGLGQVSLAWVLHLNLERMES